MGHLSVSGIINCSKETIDFFSNDGVALRALVSIGLSPQDQVFDEGANHSAVCAERRASDFGAEV